MTSNTLPGFIDLQVNGYKGADFSSRELDEEQVVAVVRGLAADGTAGFLANILSSSADVYEHNLPLLASVMENPEFSGHLLGFNLEGPFISREPGAVGCQNPQYTRQPDPAFLDRLHELARGHIRIISIAAELNGADELARHSTKLGMIAAVGHSMAMEADLARLSKAGARLITHVGNALPNMIHRHNNPLWAALANDDFSVTVIGDGHHIPLPMLKTIVRAKGVERCIIVSDSAPAAGLPPGRYSMLGNDVILEKTGRLYSPEKQCLVRSSTTIRNGVNLMAGLDFLSATELVTMAYGNPLALLGLRAPPPAAGRGLVFDQETRTFIPA